MPSRYASLASFGIFSMLKYFPIAFLVTNLKEYEDLPSLSRDCPVDLDAEVQVTFTLNNLKSSDWPDDGNNIVCGGGITANSSVSAYMKGTCRKKASRASRTDGSLRQ